MKTYQISVINHTFSATNEHELESLHEAGRQGVRAALAIGVEEVTNGTPFFGAEVRIENDGETLGRFMVSVGSTPLQ